MKKSIIIFAACALIAGPAAAQSIAEKTGINEVLGITPSTADFVKEAATSDMFEIEFGASLRRKRLPMKRPKTSPIRWSPITRRRLRS